MWEFYLLYTFIKVTTKSVHVSIKLYILPYNNTVIQLVTFVISVRIAYKYIYFYLKGETGLLNSPALGVYCF